MLVNVARVACGRNDYYCTDRVLRREEKILAASDCRVCFRGRLPSSQRLFAQGMLLLPFLLLLLLLLLLFLPFLPLLLLLETPCRVCVCVRASVGSGHFGCMRQLVVWGAPA